MTPNMRTWVKRSVLVVIVLLVVAQVVRPDRTNPPADPAKTLEATGRATPEVTAIVARACRDCHSNETAWPWYSHVAPLSWLLANHVNTGRRELSFSTWGDYGAKDAAEKLEETCEQLREREMPLASYVLLHAEAALSDADRQVVCDWTARERARLAPSAEQR